MTCHCTSVGIWVQFLFVAAGVWNRIWTEDSAAGLRALYIYINTYTYVFKELSFIYACILYVYIYMYMYVDMDVEIVGCE